jgi:integrase
MGAYRRGKIWYIRFKGPDGRMIRQSTGQESKRLAEDILKKQKIELAEDKFLDKQERPSMTFPELCEWYWEHHGRHLKWNGLRGLLNRLKGFFKDRLITAITPELVCEYIALRRSRDRISTTTANRDLQLLKSMFNLIINYKRWRKVLENPVGYLKLFKENHGRVRFLEQDEIQRLLEACDEHLRPVVICALYTGMRKSKIFNLKWRDVDLRRKTIFLLRTKNGESRHLPISGELEKVLLSLPSRFEGGYVFPSYLPRRNEDLKSGEVNEPFTDVKNSFHKALKKAGIEDFRFHDLRHTFASHLVMSGADLNVVRELLGHKSLQMTLRYAHLSVTHKHDSICLIDKALGGTMGSLGDTPSDTATILRFRRSS